MRKLFVLVAVLLLATVAYAQTPAADVKLGVHDVLNVANTQRQGCQSCHVPHAATVHYYLWRWTVPTSANGNPLPALNDASFHTNSCISCHDGATAAAVVDLSGMGAAKMVANDGLANDHPVDVMYSQHGSTPPTLAFTRFYTPSGYTLVRNIDPNTGATLSGTEFGMIECSSCHNPHAGQSYRFLRSPRGTFATSDFAKLTFCRDCHSSR